MYSKDAGIIAVKEKYIQILGIALTLLYSVFVMFLYAAEPRSLEEISSKAVETVQNAASRGQVITGTYEIDQAKFNEALTDARRYFKGRPRELQAIEDAAKGTTQ